MAYVEPRAPFKLGAPSPPQFQQREEEERRLRQRLMGPGLSNAAPGSMFAPGGAPPAAPPQPPYKLGAPPPPKRLQQHYGNINVEDLTAYNNQQNEQYAPPGSPSPPTVRQGAPGYQPPTTTGPRQTQTGGNQSPAFSINSNFQAPPVYTGQQTNEAVNRAKAQAHQNTIPMFLRQAQRPGMSARGQVGNVLPRYAQAQAGGALAAQLIPFMHAQANAGQQLQGQRLDWNRQLGLLSGNLEARNLLNRYGQGGMNTLAQIFARLLQQGG